MARRRAAANDEPSSSNLVRCTSWAGVQAGDLVDVLGDRERGATWRFAAFVTNVATNASWVEVVGGRGGEQRRRSFETDQLFPYRSIRGGIPRAAPLHDAPGLPLASS